jgi:hypothetical protein
MATQTATGSGGTKNNGGTIIGGGAVDTNGPISNNLQVKDLATNNNHGSKVVKQVATSADFTDTYGLIEANPNSAGGLAYNGGYDNFIIRGAGTTRAGKINGVSSNLLNSTAAEFSGVPRNKKNTVQTAKKLGNPTWTWPILPGSGRHPGLDRNDAGSGFSFSSPTDGSGIASDKVVSASLSVPGELTYRTGAALPKNTNFKPRNVAE